MLRIREIPTHSGEKKFLNTTTCIYQTVSTDVITKICILDSNGLRFSLISMLESLAVWWLAISTIILCNLIMMVK